HQPWQKLALNDVLIARLAQFPESRNKFVAQRLWRGGRLSEQFPAGAQAPDAHTHLMDILDALVSAWFHAVHGGKEGAVADDLVDTVVGALQVSFAKTDIGRQYWLPVAQRRRDLTLVRFRKRG